VGILNVLSVLRNEFGQLRQFPAVSGVAQSMALLGIGTRLILGIGLVFAGTGLLWRHCPEYRASG